MKTRLPMKSSFKNELFFKLIDKILDSNNELRDLRNSFNLHKNKYDLLLNHGYYELTTKGQNEYIFFNLSKRYSDREYIFSLIFENTSGTRNLYMEIECIGGPIELDRIPPFMLKAMEAVSNCEYIITPPLGSFGEIIHANESNIEQIVNCIENYSYDIPMILSTAFINSHAYDIDEHKLLKNLRGFAYIVLVSNDFTDIIKRKANIYNGTVVLYSKEEYKVARNTDKLFGSNINELAFNFVSNRSQNVIMPKIKDEAINTNDEAKELKNQLDREREKNAMLNQEIREIACENKALKKALEQADKGSFTITKPEEIYDGEAIDLIIHALTALEKRCNPRQERKIMLIREIINSNPRTQNGEKLFSELKFIFRDGVEMNATKLATLSKIGLEKERDNGHYILNFKNVYKFITSKSPSDDRSGKNLYSDIKNAICVFI
ncbi:MAG: hypothetical protein II984_08245 [Clostridia bacterium]|nr:hypothetical protein [Clostridia bacterium]